jgi:hypothetical protein
LPKLDDDPWLTRKEATAFLKSIGCSVAPQTLANLASNNNEGGGPPFRRFRKRVVRYQLSRLKEWASKQTEDVGTPAPKIVPGPLSIASSKRDLIRTAPRTR